MNPDVVAAIARLRTDTVLSAPQATLFDRVARRHLVSVRLEIRLLLYFGVLLLTSGVGVLVVEHQKEIGPLAIAGALALGTLTCLAWVVRTAPPFSWQAVESPNVAFDYILLLGVLLFASALGYVEAQFTVLGERWAHHLLVVGVVYFLAAYRWDSRTVLSLALTTLAAWRGVSMSLLSVARGTDSDAALRANALALGALYLLAAVVSVRLGRKPHFEDVFANAGLLLLLGALVSGALGDDPRWGWWILALVLAAGAVMLASWELRRSLYFAEGVVAAYLALIRLFFEPFHGQGSGGQTSAIPFVLAAAL